ncbi:ATP-binding protein [Pontibacter sp. E15-1]|uniref:sensor histidine kinase n=1 Tax=Pontibacter sp. E15-1 TaxID=2919918 RepID=UPI001F4FF6A3|nr:HAMP domain-containing sensor histidine kinase [Pontibacter sp. E15-1]MCJ8165273.1 ATP-binding protein [Pontibacter sp. E15-1]
MNRKFTPFILLLVSLLCFAATAVLQFSSPAATPPDNHEAEMAALTAQVQAEVARAEKSARVIGQQLHARSISFTSLLEQCRYPVFIYRQGRLVFWSHHTIAPAPELLMSTARLMTVSNQHGSFLVVPYRVKQYDIKIYVPLQVKYHEGEQYKNLAQGIPLLQRKHLNLVWDPVTDLPKIFSRQGHFLFAVDFAAAQGKDPATTIQLLLLLAGTVFFVLFSFSLARVYIRKGHYGKGVLLFLLLLVVFRVALLLLNLPFSIAEVKLFDPKLYAASFWSPSIGDLALNMLLLLTVAASGLYLFERNKVLAQLVLVPKQQRRLLQAGCMVVFYLLLLLLYKFYFDIYRNTPLTLDVSRSLDFTKYKLLLFGVMLCHTLALCIFTYMLATVVSVLAQRETRWWAYQALLSVALIATLFTGFFFPELSVIILTGFLFWVIIILAAQHRNAVSLAYRTYLFFFLVVIVSALTGAMALYAHYHSELKLYKQEFAYSILQDNDVLGEYLLEEDVTAKIASDAVIRMQMKGPYVDVSLIKRKITKQYLPSYFDKYEINVMLFDGEGKSLESADTAATTLQDLRRFFDTPQTQTEHPDLFLLKDPTRYNARVYLKLIEVPVYERQKGTIALQLTLKKLLPNSVVPELLVDQKYEQPFRRDMLSYAFYSDGKLRYSEGEYDYATNFERSLLQQTDLYRQGANQGNYHHFGVRSNSNQTLVITTEKYGSSEILANFSFLFLVFVAGLVTSGLIYLLLQRHSLQEFSPNFSTKIQIFLNFGILLPLLLVSIATAGLVTASYKKDLMAMYERRGEAVQQALSRQLPERIVQNKRYLEARIADIAAISETDINLYDRHGRLLVTSQPLIFETGLLSKLINPKAFAAISERQALRVLLEEHTGSLSFNVVYLPLRSEVKGGELIGFIGLPFFDSEKELDLKLIELITTTMNIFTVMFITFMVLTFFASRTLTVPLRMLADKLKRTSLTGKNEMLAYEGADEIGMLVNEYNRMLLTLEQNKQELAVQEKEAAWREMARQVAHEIKNPLTPMKLSLQYLQKVIAEKRPNAEQMINKISHTLITQINILSDIATSFSSFTNMPEPRAERMDVAAALHKAADLHNDPATAQIRKCIPDQEAIVLADEGLMVRTFNNLLLNAIQSVPAARKPQITVTLAVQGSSEVLISIKDNGSGIPEEIRGKVFIPNFSTKYTGSGIGLAVARRGIENAGGKIWFETEEGKGTTFFISLPLA